MNMPDGRLAAQGDRMTPIALQERSCHLKRRYFTEIDALVMAGKRQVYGAPKLRAYQCQFCGGWHLTKKTKEKA